MKLQPQTEDSFINDQKVAQLPTKMVSVVNMEVLKSKTSNKVETINLESEIETIQKPTGFKKKKNRFKEGKLSPSAHNKNKRSIKLIRSSLKKQKKSRLKKISKQRLKGKKLNFSGGLRRSKTTMLPPTKELTKEDFLDNSEPYINLKHYNFRVKKSHTCDISHFNPEQVQVEVKEPVSSEGQNLENMPDFKFPVYKEDKIFITRRRSGTKFLKSFTVKQELDFDVESTDEMIDDAVYLGVKGWMRSLLEEQNADYTDVLEGKKGFRRRRTLKKFVQDYKLWNDSESESESESESGSETESGSESGFETETDSDTSSCSEEESQE